MPSRTWRIVGFALIFLAGMGALYQIIAPRLQPLPEYMPVPQVALTDENGHPFDLDQTRGKVVVLSLIYTHCPDICPLTTAKMKQIQDRLKAAGLSSQVELVTFTVDPERDTTDVLKRFAGIFNADPSNWVFLTGTDAQIQTMISKLDLYVERVYYVGGTPVPASSEEQIPPGTPYLVNHTDRLFLADRLGMVRALEPGSRTDVDEAINMIRQIAEQ